MTFGYCMDPLLVGSWLSYPGLKIPTGTGSGRFQTGPNLKFKFEFQKIKKFQKIPKNTSSCDNFNGVKFYQIFIHLVYFAGM